MIEYENLFKTNQVFYKEYTDFFQGFLNSGWYILGETVAKFEEAFADSVDTQYCVGVSNGLDALRLALEVYGFKDGSEVIVPSNTYIATILAILQAKLKPVLVEPDLETYNLLHFEDAITPNTVAVLPVHLYGRPCDMVFINEIAQRRGLKVIEDCAQAHGARVGKTIGCFSFYPTKNLGCLGDGGAITLNDPDLAARLKSMRNYGRTAKYENSILGWNNRLDELQAGFLLIKLAILTSITEHKRRLARLYDDLLQGIIKPKPHPDHVYHIYNIRCSRRDELQKVLLEQEIQTEIHYPIPPHKQKCLDFLQKSYPVSEEIHETTLSLPISFCHSEEEIYRVATAVNAFFD